MRVVLDTNVLVSAVLSQGSPPDTILRAWRRGVFQLITSAPLLRELGQVLARPRIRKRLGWSARERAAFVTALAESAILAVPETELHIIQNDPADNRILEAAIQPSADYIVSGDHHLLDLGAHEDVQIVTPARFAAILATIQS